MKIETQLPLGNLDPGLRAASGGLDLDRVGQEARLAEALGYDGIVCNHAWPGHEVEYEASLDLQVIYPTDGGYAAQMVDLVQKSVRDERWEEKIANGFK